MIGNLLKFGSKYSGLMTPSETLLKAIFNRLKVRLDNNVASSVSEASGFIKVAPSRIKQEWDLFKEEIIEEAGRINEIENESKKRKKEPFQKDSYHTLQDKINQIRNEIEKLSDQIEGMN